MPKSRVMSRQDFITGVEKLLGKFDSDSFIRGFEAGFERAIDVVREEVAVWGEDELVDWTRLLKNITKAQKRRRRK